MLHRSYPRGIWSQQNLSKNVTDTRLFNIFVNHGYIYAFITEELITLTHKAFGAVELCLTGFKNELLLAFVLQKYYLELM